MLEIAGGIIVAALVLAFWRPLLTLSAIALLGVAGLMLIVAAFLLMSTSYAIAATAIALAIIVVVIATKVDQAKANEANDKKGENRKTLRSSRLPIIDLHYPEGASWLKKHGALEEDAEALKPGFRIVVFELEGYRAGQLIHVAAVGESHCVLGGRRIPREALARISRAVPEVAVQEFMDSHVSVNNAKTAI